jgi:aspartyl-tRNA(Asn)/glutamyl-tRNA(Gln) amidotransferase subunit B
MPAVRLQRFVKEYRLPEYDAEVLTSSRTLSDYFEKCVKAYPEPKVISNWIMTEMMGSLNEKKLSVDNCRVIPENLAELLKLIENATISGKIAKEIFPEMFETGKKAYDIIQEKGMTQITDEKELLEIAKKVIADNPKIAADYRSGNEKVLGFLVGQLMKATQGRANPQTANKILKEKLK